MSKKPSKLEKLLIELEYPDAEDRFNALQGLRVYAGNMQAYHAVRDATRDPEREVRALANEVLAEYDQAFESSLAVVETPEAEFEDDAPSRATGKSKPTGTVAPVDNLLKELKAVDPSDRMAAVNQLRQFWQADSRVIPTLERLKAKDPNRTIRQTCAMILKKIQEEQVDGAGDMYFDGHVMVVEDPQRRAKPDKWGRKRVKKTMMEKASPGWITAIAVFFFISGAPSLAAGLLIAVIGPQSIVNLYVMMAELMSTEGIDSTAMTMELTAQLESRIANLQIVVMIVNGAWQIIASLGLLFRQEWGRWMALFYIAMAFAFGWILRSYGLMIGLGAFALMIMIFLSRRNIAREFQGHRRAAAATGRARDHEPEARARW